MVCKFRIVKITGIILLLIQPAVRSQDYVELGVSAGSGFISADSPYISGFTSSVSAGAGWRDGVLSPRLSLYYAGDFNSLLPASTKSYYPFIKAFAIKAIYSANVSGNFFYEQGLGLFAANERIFSMSNSWGTGFIITAVGGIDLRRTSLSGFMIGVGGEYGLTFYKNNVRYLGLFIQAQYMLSLNP